MVGFRYFVVERAGALGLTGWVRNGEDGRSVEIVAEGEEQALEELEAALRLGPSTARVDSVETDRSIALTGYATFEART
jgi:acylphosphatase